MQVGGREFVGSLNIHSCGWRVSACPTRLDWSHVGVCRVLRFLTCTTSGADVVTTWSWVAVTGAAPMTKTSKSRPEAAIASFCLFCLPRTRLRCFLGPLGAVPFCDAMFSWRQGLGHQAVWWSSAREQVQVAVRVWVGALEAAGVPSTPCDTGAPRSESRAAVAVCPPHSRASLPS